MKISPELADELTFGEVGEEFEGCVIVEKGDWIHEGKCEYQEIIFRHNDVHYELMRGRSGSDFTDWHYDDGDDDCPEVRKVEVVTHKWERIK